MGNKLKETIRFILKVQNAYIILLRDNRKLIDL